MLDEAYDRLHLTGPEFRGWLPNHGPMAVDALLRLGGADLVADWVTRYARRLEPLPAARWPITEPEWREPLGDPSRMGDWLAFFARALADEPWQEVLCRWWPRLLPGALAAATHGIIRTGHAVRALRVRVSAPRTAELAHALGYWAARWQQLRQPGQLRGRLSCSEALAAVPSLPRPGGFRTRVAAVEHSERFQQALRQLDSRHTVGVLPHAMSTLIDSAVSAYFAWSHAHPVMLVHIASAPRAAALVLPSIPRDQWEDTYHTAWVMAATVAAAYRPGDSSPRDQARAHQEAGETDPESVVAAALHHQDEHVLELVDVACESHRRGSRLALPAARRAITLINRPRSGAETS
jgi:hypothetical protein